MKKQIKSFIILLSTALLLSSCSFLNKDKVDDAKKELGIIKQEIVETSPNNTGFIENTEEKIQEIEKEIEIEKIKKVDEAKPSFKIDYISKDKFVELDDIEFPKTTFGEITISGKTLTKVDKIKVSFLNKQSDYPKDDYTLTKFKSGDKTFIYHASSKFKVLDFGKNEYLITAYSGDEVSKTSLIINIPKDFNPPKAITYEKKLIGKEDDTLYMNFPKGGSFGDPILTGVNTFTYSKVDNLEVEKIVLEEVTCEKLTDYLQKNLNSWFYWNTCKDIIKDKGISFYVIRLDGDNYLYEKHYIDNYHGLVGVYLIETGTGITLENIKEKNSLLKEINEDFENIETVDLLFREIVR